MSEKEGGRGRREGGIKKGDQSNLGSLRVEIITRRKEQTKTNYGFFLSEKLQQRNSWGQDT